MVSKHRCPTHPLSVSQLYALGGLGEKCVTSATHTITRKARQYAMRVKPGERPNATPPRSDVSRELEGRLWGRGHHNMRVAEGGGHVSRRA